MSEFPTNTRIHVDDVRSARLLDSFNIHVWPGTNLLLGPQTEIEPPCSLLGGVDSPDGFRCGAFSYSWSRITRFVGTIGRYCSIAGQVNLGDWEHPTSALTTSVVTFDHHFPLGAYAKKRNPKVVKIALSVPKPICLDHDVWIGKGSYIRSGVSIGTGAIVGSNAVVTRDVPPYAVVVGAPATIKKFRFPDELIEKLLATAWWQYSWADIGDIDPKDPAAACDAIAERRQRGQLRPFTPPLLSALDMRTAAEAPRVHESLI